MSGKDEGHQLAHSFDCHIPFVFHSPKNYDLKIIPSCFPARYAEWVLARYSRFLRPQRPPLLGWFHTDFLPELNETSYFPPDADFNWISSVWAKQILSHQKGDVFDSIPCKFPKVLSLTVNEFLILLTKNQNRWTVRSAQLQWY